MIGTREIDGFEALTLGSTAEGGLEVALVPEAGMVVPSLLHRGEELLGQRGGLAHYARQRSTMGIPLLYPWANRLAVQRFDVGGAEVDLSLADPPVGVDPQGLPIHGMLSAAPGWRVCEHAALDDGGLLAAEFEFAAPGLIGAFPFPHRIRVEARLEGARLQMATTILASGPGPVPVAFGYHPYFTLPGVPRSEWDITIPVAERLALDGRMIPTGGVEPAAVAAGPLGERTFDDAFRSPPPGSPPFRLAGGGRRIELRFDEGYPFTQVYAPADDEVIAVEPMTAPTNALVSGDGLRWVDPGGSFTAAFAIEIGAG